MDCVTISRCVLRNRFELDEQGSHKHIIELTVGLQAKEHVPRGPMNPENRMATDKDAGALIIFSGCP